MEFFPGMGMAVIIVNFQFFYIFGFEKLHFKFGLLQELCFLGRIWDIHWWLYPIPDFFFSWGLVWYFVSQVGLFLFVCLWNDGGGASNVLNCVSSSSSYSSSERIFSLNWSSKVSAKASALISLYNSSPFRSWIVGIAFLIPFRRICWGARMFSPGL